MRNVAGSALGVVLVVAATTAEEVGGAPTFLNLGNAHPAPNASTS